MFARRDLTRISNEILTAPEVAEGSEGRLSAEHPPQKALVVAEMMRNEIFDSGAGEDKRRDLS